MVAQVGPTSHRPRRVLAHDPHRPGTRRTPRTRRPQTLRLPAHARLPRPLLHQDPPGLHHPRRPTTGTGRLAARAGSRPVRWSGLCSVSCPGWGRAWRGGSHAGPATGQLPSFLPTPAGSRAQRRHPLREQPPRTLHRVAHVEQSADQHPHPSQRLSLALPSVDQRAALQLPHQSGDLPLAEPRPSRRPLGQDPASPRSRH